MVPYSYADAGVGAETVRVEARARLNGEFRIREGAFREIGARDARVHRNNLIYFIFIPFFRSNMAKKHSQTHFLKSLPAGYYSTDNLR